MNVGQKLVDQEIKMKMQFNLWIGKFMALSDNLFFSAPGALVVISVSGVSPSNPSVEHLDQKLEGPFQ